MNSYTSAAILSVSGLILSACALVGPTIQVQPPLGKTFAAFEADRRACMAGTDQQVQPIANRRASTPAQIQQIYNVSYGQCMSSRGNLVAATAMLPSANGADASGLSDPGSVAALRSLAPVIDEAKRNCEGDQVAARVTEAALSPSVNARIIELTTPNGGSCFGQPGSNAYLVAKSGSGWRRLLSAEPGSIQQLNSRHNGYADLEMSSLGLCVYTYRWNGRQYAKAGSHDCMTSAPPTVGSLARGIRERR